MTQETIDGVVFLTNLVAAFIGTAIVYAIACLIGTWVKRNAERELQAQKRIDESQRRIEKEAYLKALLEKMRDMTRKEVEP
jgi:membrane protein DedA with SNARE-associated domain